jgi:hypothetical protein
MFRTTVSCKTLVVVLLLLLAESLQARAHLNGDISSIAADARAVQASVRKTALVSYEVHEFQSSALNSRPTQPPSRRFRTRGCTARCV